MRPKHLRRNFTFIHLTMNDFTTGFRTHMNSYKYSIVVYKHFSDGMAKGDRRVVEILPSDMY